LSVDFSRQFPDEDGITLQGQYFDYDIMIYVENLGSKVTGSLNYIDNAGTVREMAINDFYLDLYEGQELVKNLTFKKFWDTFEEKKEEASVGEL